MKYNRVCMVSVQKHQRQEKPEEDWETLRNLFLHKTLVQSLCSSWLCAHSVCAPADLALDMDIHYLRFPEAIKPHGCWTTKQWPLPHLFPMEQSWVCACECLCGCVCTLTGQTLSTLLSYTLKLPCSVTGF